MGERHQIYMRMPDKTRISTEFIKNCKVIGIHHQWIFGVTLCSNILRMLQWEKHLSERGKKYWNGFWEWEGEKAARHVLGSLFSVNHESGYYHNTIDFVQEELDYMKDEDYKKKNILFYPGFNPYNGDNNTGITVFDFRERGNPKYCIMKIGTEFFSESVKEFKPISAMRYLQDYIKANESEDKEYKLDESIMDHAKKLIKDFRKYKLLKMREIKEMFPVVFMGKKEREKWAKKMIRL